MTSKLCLFLFSFILLSLTEAKKICPSLEEFERANKNFGGKGYSEFKSSFQGNLINYMSQRSKLLGSGGYGEVFELKDFKDVVVKKVKIDDIDDLPFFFREVELLRFVCDRKDSDFDKYIVCKSKFIASFHGCFTQGNSIYEFQEKMTWDLYNKDVVIAYRALRPYQRVVVMLDIIDRFIELHKLKIVHGDIKPENIMLKKKDFSDIRIIDLGIANAAGEEYIGGTHGYQPPEAYSSINLLRVLRFTNDVFALGMTFAELEGNFSDHHQIIIKKCFQNRPLDLCGQVIEDGLVTAFTSDKGLISLLPVIRAAVHIKMTKRLENMQKFADEMIKVFKKLEGADAFIEDLKKKRESEASADEFPSYWKNKLAPRKTVAIEKPKAEENKSKDGILAGILRFFTCGSKKPKKAKKNVIPITDKTEEKGGKKIKILL